ncbi:MAG: CRISPR-associated endonuclease Cas3'' [Clostridium sp.]|nr:CRISPR-associated endonuclease Cas3'' [Clostridium sp.]MCM1399126.1 CRISPR-associated endonuclease Cas3'' [Clostridium sp.]MCM1459518.1 CRISPR-associated endonuclease Cas3'' [Bacteroides sp.]
MNYINELRDGDMISEVYLCKSKLDLKTKAGKSYYSLSLQDRTGTVDAKIWELNNGISHFEAMDYIRVEAQVTTFNGALQLNIKRVRVADAGEFDPSDYMPCSEKNIEEMYKELLGLVDSINEPHVKALLKSVFVDDRAFVEKFKKHSAAKSIHHGFIGGLLEHSLSVAKLCGYLAEQYPVLKRDLLVSAALLHDIGKVDELSDFPENDYTDKGQLVGHIVMGTMLVNEKIKEIPDFPAGFADELLHCILSHHGELEYGSPKKPALIEALALAHADNIDAKIQTFTELLNANKDKSGWLGYNKMFESNVRMTND